MRSIMEIPRGPAPTMAIEGCVAKVLPLVGVEGMEIFARLSLVLGGEVLIWKSIDSVVYPKKTIQFGIC